MSAHCRSSSTTMRGISRVKDASIERSSWVNVLTVGAVERAGARSEAQAAAGR
jgi:hypothetical protein